jgi:hypothetical protein
MSVDGATGPHGRDDDVVVRKADRGWVVGGENVSDLTSAIVLADLFAAAGVAPLEGEARVGAPASISFVHATRR